MKVDDAAAKSNNEIMKEKADTRPTPLEKLMSARKPDLALEKIGAEPVRHILQASLSVRTYGDKNQ